MPYCHFFISPGPPPPPDSGIRNFPQPWRTCHTQPGSAEQMSQLHIVNHVDHVTMPVTLVTVDHLLCCAAPMHKVDHNVQLPNF